jgi:sugar phosphate isomerase/epimerase
MVRSAITIALVPEARSGPFVFHDGLEAGCAAAARLGFDAIELFPRSARELDRSALRLLIGQHQLAVAAIGTGAGWVVHQLRLTDPDAGIRERARAFVKDIIECAAEFNAPAIIGSMQGRAEGDTSREQALQWLAEGLEMLGAHAATHGVPLIYEPLNRYETNLANTVAEGVALLQSLSTRNVKLLCDCFHMNIEERSIADSLRAAGPLVGHVHFADSNRRAAGFGHTDFAPIAAALREIGYDGFLSAEIFPLPDVRHRRGSVLARLPRPFPQRLNHAQTPAHPSEDQ